ncbi:diguanylate cyclase [Salinicoccus jeotgali]|uniref:Diguanylate cyclase n=2 Tax=Salinicoccus jeotgali TaxID=381634 RepID=A0ABP7F1U8_9STAP
MIMDMFILFCMLITFIYIYFQLKWRLLSFLRKKSSKALYGGSMSGMFAIILNYYAVVAHGEVFFSLSMVVLVLSFVFTGRGAYAIGSLIFMIWIGFSPLAIPTISLPDLLRLFSALFLLDFLLQNRQRYFKLFLFTLVLNLEYLSSLLWTGPAFDRTLISSFYYLCLSFLSITVGASVINYMIRSENLLQKYEMEASTDGLTGVYNRRIFDEQMNRLSGTRNAAMILIDIDHFKSFNDNYGHAEGDRILKAVTHELSSLVSEGLMARIGGEEFAVILNDYTMAQAAQLAEIFRSAIEDSTFTTLDGTVIKVTISLGVAVYPDQVDSVEELYPKADEHLYKAKAMGRNQVCCDLL